METSGNKNLKRSFVLISIFFFVFITLFSFSGCRPTSEKEEHIIESEDSGVDSEDSKGKGNAFVLYNDLNWVKGTNIYEIFVDRFGGTLQGVTQKIDYLEKLGIKTIWLMPIFRAMSDHGYDTTDYYDIEPRYGTINDLNNLVEAAHGKGIRIILSLVMNHCGTKHPWFSSSNDSERKDHWFIWAGSDLGWPDSWMDYKSGYIPMATWFPDPYRSLDRNHNGDQNDDDYYFSLFGSNTEVATMPDLNFNDPNSRAEILNEFENVMKFWIQIADVDGFLCDAVRYLVENGRGHQKDQPETHSIWKEIRSRLGQIKPGAILLAAAPTENADQMIEYYGNGDEFHTAFHFNLQGRLMNCLKNERRPSDLLLELYAIQGRLPAGTQDTIFLSNHDRFAGDRAATQLNGYLPKIKSVASLYLLLSGNPTIYYGEEIGMANGPGSIDDPVRHPMDWNEAQSQENDPDSILNHYRRLLKLRNEYDALREGITYFVPTHSNDGWDGMYSESKTLSIIREFNGEKILIAHNFSSQNQTIHINLSESGLAFPLGSEAQALMGGGNYPPVSDSNKTYYSLGTVYAFTTRVIFFGDINRYTDPNGKFLTYENNFPDSWYFRGTPNDWGSTLMELNDQGLWETVQTFGGENPRFKVSHYEDNWNEAYPASDYLITEGAGTYEITFDSSGKRVKGVVKIGDLWYFRGTPNNWGSTSMQLNDQGLWETVQTFGGENPRFKISHYEDNWNEAYPATDYLITEGAGTYEITFDSSEKTVKGVKKIGDSWYFRGTPNNWDSFLMDRNDQGLWETVQTFGGENPRFKISHYKDNWNEAYPATDYLITEGAGTYEITFDSSEKKVKGVKKIGDSWYFRGTPNNWGSTSMQLNDQGLWETVQTFGGENPRFKISHYEDNWNEAYPATDYLITEGAGIYKITFNSTIKVIEVEKQAEN